MNEPENIVSPDAVRHYCTDCGAVCYKGVDDVGIPSWICPECGLTEPI